MKILHIFPTFGLGGQQRRFADIVNGLGPEYSHKIISLNEDCAAMSLIEDHTELDCDIVLLNKGGAIDLSNIKQLLSRVRAEQPGILCTYNWGAMDGVIAFNAGRLGLVKSGPAHIHFEDGFGPDESIDSQNSKRVLTRRLALRNSLTIVPSTTLETLALGQWGLKKDRIKRIPNGIDLDRFIVANRNFDCKSAITIGTVGAFRPEKRLDRLIANAASCTAPLRVVLVGDGPQMQSLQMAAQDEQHKVSVEFPGATSRAEDWYRQFDIFALSSDTEQMPISLIEAMAAGLPVVATDVGDIRQMVAEENRQFITPLGDENAYRESLMRLAQSPSMRERLGKANQAKAMSEFGRNEMIATYRDLFQSLVRKEKPTRAQR